MTIAVSIKPNKQTKVCSNSLSPGQFCMKMQMSLWLAIFINLVLDDALGHQQEQNFIRGREKIDKGRKMGWRGREVGERGGWKWGEMGREVGNGYPPVHPLHKRAVRLNHIHNYV